MTDTLTRLPDAELEVMQALWALDTYPAHTADIAARLERDWKAPTLLKLLSRLEERGFVRGEKAGRANLYTPLVAQKDYLKAAQSGGRPVARRQVDPGGRGCAGGAAGKRRSLIWQKI